MGELLAGARGTVRARLPLNLRMRVAGGETLRAPRAWKFYRLSKICGPWLRTPCGEGDPVPCCWNRTTSKLACADREVCATGLRSSQEAGVGLGQAGGATDEASDFGQ